MMQTKPLLRVSPHETRNTLPVINALKRILIASHGTPGARAAEQAAYGLCGPQTTLHHLIVVPDFWKGMMGDDWLNSAWTRDDFGDYVESRLENEIRDHIACMQGAASSHGVDYGYQVMLGKPAECLVTAAETLQPDLIVIGSPRPKGIPGFRSRLRSEDLVRRLKAPLWIAPYPR